MLLQVMHLSKSFGPADVLRDVSFALERGERAGLVGANGAGKTTLLRILAGHESADAGTLARAPSVTLGYLPQSTPPFTGSTIADLIAEAVGDLRRIEARMRELEAWLAATPPPDDPAVLLDEYGALATRFQDRGGYELEHRTEAVLAGLDLAYLPSERKVVTLSGGEKARVGLAALLLSAPDVLLLDEPTNHLDAGALAWLESFLAGYPGAVLTVSHDREFLNRTVNRILAIDDYTHELRRYEGDYDAYAAARAAELATRHEAYDRQQEAIEELRRRVRLESQQVGHHRRPTDNDKSLYNFKGEQVARTVSRNVRAAQERLARLEAHPIEKPPKPLRFAPRFQGEQPASRTVIRAENLAKHYGERTLFAGVSFALPPDARVILAGPNGAGKTTLLRLLLGLEAPDDGSVRLAPGTCIGYLPQEPRPLAPGQTLLQAYREGLTGPEGTLVASILGNGLFRLDDLDKPVGALSLGQRRKLEIARLVAERPNALVLDEPTNYLSLDVLEAFEVAVREFLGPVLVVTHDRWFMRRFGGERWLLEGGRLEHDGGSSTVQTA
jgi:macrolide transport system ATP-binding/permease protein